MTVLDTAEVYGFGGPSAAPTQWVPRRMPPSQEEQEAAGQIAWSFWSRLREYQPKGIGSQYVASR